MNTSARPQTSRNRDRAIGRLRSITTGTAVAATIATAGFGGLAAFTYSGTSTDTTGSVDTTVPGGSSIGGTTTTDRAKSTTTGVTGLQQVPAPTASSRHKARVTSGGSGG